MLHYFCKTVQILQAGTVFASCQKLCTNYNYANQVKNNYELLYYYIIIIIMIIINDNYEIIIIVYLFLGIVFLFLGIVYLF